MHAHCVTEHRITRFMNRRVPCTLSTCCTRHKIAILNVKFGSPVRAMHVTTAWFNPCCFIESRVELLLDLKSKYCELDAVQGFFFLVFFGFLICHFFAAFRCIELLRDHAVHFVCDGSLNSASSVPAPTSRPFIQLAAPLPLRSACKPLHAVAWIQVSVRFRHLVG